MNELKENERHEDKCHFCGVVSDEVEGQVCAECFALMPVGVWLS